MVLVVTPAIDGLKREWAEAAQSLGASAWQYWRMVALPILMPSALGAALLLFANAFGAIATAYALTGSSFNIAPILLYAQIRGDVLHDPNLGYAMAVGMLAITGLSNLAYLALRARVGAGAMTPRAARRLGRGRARGGLFPRAPDRDLRVLAAHAARRLQFRRLSRRVRQRRVPRRRSSIRP